MTRLLTILITSFLIVSCTTIENKPDKNITTELDYSHLSSRGFYKTGELRYSYRFINGIRQGITNEYYKSGELKN